MSNEHIGSGFEEFLREEGIFEEVEAGAIKKVVARMIEQAMAETHITKTETARRMETSRAQLDRLLDPAYPSVTLATIAKAATALGKKMSISFEDFLPAKNDMIASQRDSAEKRVACPGRSGALKEFCHGNQDTSKP